jgi:hypothetical protein
MDKVFGKDRVRRSGRFLGLLSGIICLIPLSAMADQAAATKCRASLPDEPKLIYDKSAPLVTPSTDLKGVLRSQTRALVLAGKVSLSTAPDSAREAAQCLELLQK